MIKKVGSRYCVFDKSGQRRIACHATEADAKRQLAAIEASKHRELHALQSGLLRTAIFEGREHIVVPVIALVPGVIHAHNSLQPELVRLEDLEQAPQGWNGRPIMFGHPSRDGRQISANEPTVLEEHRIGTIFNARVDGGKLKMDAYVDPERARSAGAGSILDALQRGEQTEVSVGVFVTLDQKPGADGGLRYEAVWQDIVPDHLAFLEEGVVGACSIEMGCGALRAAGGKGSGNFGHAGRPGQIGGSAPGTGGGDDEKGDFSRDGGASYDMRYDGALKLQRGSRIQWKPSGDSQVRSGRITKIEKTPGRDLIYTIDTGQRTPYQESTSSLAQKGFKNLEGQSMTILEKFKALLESFVPSDPKVLEDYGQTADELRTALHQALMATVPGFIGVDSYYPEEHKVIYASAPEGALMLHRCDYRMTDAGGVELDVEGGEEVQQITRFEPVNAAAFPGAAPPFKKKGEKSAVYEKGSRYCHKTADGKEMCHDTEEEARAMVEGKKERAAAGNCGCGGKTEGTPAGKENDMTKKELVQKILAQKKSRFAAADAPILEQLSEERLTALATEPEPVPEPTPEEQRQKFLSMFPDVKLVLDREKARDTARHAELVAACAGVKQEAYSEADLKAMPLESLEKITKLITASVPKKYYSGAGVPRAASSVTEEEIPAAPSLSRSIRIARGIEKAS